jgi:hypothetical protein
LISGFIGGFGGVIGVDGKVRCNCHAMCIDGREDRIERGKPGRFTIGCDAARLRPDGS